MKKKAIIFLILAAVIGFTSGCGRKLENAATTSPGSEVIGLNFNLTVDNSFPSGESVYLSSDRGTFKMVQIDAYHWQKQLTAVTGTFSYAYLRNDLGFMAAEEFSPDESSSTWDRHRALSVPADGNYLQNDAVTKWRWLPATSEVIPATPSSAAGSTAWLARVNGETFQRGVVLQDYWRDGFTELFDYTADHMLENNIRCVEVAPGAEYLSTAEPVSILKIAPGFTDSILRNLIRSFRAKGIEVLLCPQIGGISLGSSPPPGSWWDSWFAEYGIFLNYYASLAADEGCSGLIISGGDNMLPGRSCATADATSRWNNLVSGARARFSGKLGYQLGMNADFSELVELTYFKNIISLFDVVGVKMWDKLTDIDDPSQSELDTAVANQFNTLIKPVWDIYSKPVIFTQIAYPSAYGGNRGAGKYPADDVRISMWDTYDASVSLDLVGQAKVFEAILKETASRPYIIGAYIFGYTYWKSIDKNYSIRSKPAEAICKGWFGRF